MRKYKIISLVLIIAVLHSCSPANKSQQDFNFNELTYYSSRCNGSCPEIAMHINEDGRIELNRTIFVGKGRVDSSRSNAYKGKLSETDIRNLRKELIKVNWDAVVFPDITCCDAPVKTILINYNGVQKKFKSMTPPQETAQLIKFLTDLAVRVDLPVSTTAIDFQEY